MPSPDSATAPRAGDLITLMTLFSPSFPIGGFAWSHGMETAIAERRLSDGDSVLVWIAFVIAEGSGWNDAVLFAESFHAAVGADEERLRAVNELALALPGSLERRLESEQQGDAFRIASAPWAAAPPVLASVPVAYAVVAGAVAGASGVALQGALAAFLHAFASQLVSVATRLVPLGQTQAVRVLHALAPTIDTVAHRAAQSTLDDLGSAALVSDIAAMRHETLQPRLFRS